MRSASAAPFLVSIAVVFIVYPLCS